MTKKIQCKKHKYICKKIEVLSLEDNLPLECLYCGKIYFSENPLVFRALSFKSISICSQCQEKLTCSACKQKFLLKKFFVAECIQCGKIEFFCKKCSKKIPLLPSNCDSHQKIFRKLQRILKEFLPDLGNKLPKNLEELKKFKDYKDFPAHLFLHFNIILPADFEIEDDEDDEVDWWKNK